MTKNERKEILALLADAQETCRFAPECYGLSHDIGRAMELLVCLVAGDRKCEWYDVAHARKLCSHQAPMKEKLRKVEENVREAASRYQNAKEEMSLGDRLVFDRLDDAVWTVIGIWEDIGKEDSGGNA